MGTLPPAACQRAGTGASALPYPARCPAVDEAAAGAGRGHPGCQALHLAPRMCSLTRGRRDAGASRAARRSSRGAPRNRRCCRATCCGRRTSAERSGPRGGWVSLPSRACEGREVQLSARSGAHIPMDGAVVAVGAQHGEVSLHFVAAANDALAGALLKVSIHPLVLALGPGGVRWGRGAPAVRRHAPQPPCTSPQSGRAPSGPVRCSFPAAAR